jgi:predicted phage terminase large subunit-like protein
MPTRQVTIDLHKTQHAFRHSTALYRGYVGGRGSGKTFVGAYDLIRRAKAGALYGVYAPSYPMMRDATQRTFLALARQLGFLREWRKADGIAILGNRAEVLFRSLDDPERARGPNLSGSWIDEASIVPRGAFDIIIAALREGGEQGWLSATFTPKGKSHWTYETFGMGKPDTALFRSRTKDNPFLPGAFAETIAQQYTSQLASQELEGEFIDMEGALAKREWFPVVDILLPPTAQRVRAWDFAATERSVNAADPDWLVGVKMVRHAGLFYVEHVVRVRIGPGEVEPLLRQIANLDGRTVSITMEQEPGSAGKIFTRQMIMALAGYPIEAKTASGDKVTRAMPFLAQAQAGYVKLVRGAWNAEYLDEMVAFPVGAHDDQVDATSAAFTRLTGGAQRARSREY